MTTLAFDIWDDLRRKRLWPIALALLVAIVAVPLVLLRPSGDEPAPAPAVATTPSATAAAAGFPGTPELVELDGTSKLGRFGKADPFAPMPGVPGLEEETDTATSGSDGAEPFPDIDDGGDAGPTDGVTVDGGVDSSGGASSPPSTGGSSSPPSVASSGRPEAAPQPSGGGRDGTEPPVERTRTVDVRYEVDVSFGPVGEVGPREGLEPSDLLPKRKPMLMLSGVAADARPRSSPSFAPSSRWRGTASRSSDAARCSTSRRATSCA